MRAQPLLENGGPSRIGVVVRRSRAHLAAEDEHVADEDGGLHIVVGRAATGVADCVLVGII